MSNAFLTPDAKAAVDRLVREAPPLSAEQVARLRLIMRGAR